MKIKSLFFSAVVCAAGVINLTAKSLSLEGVDDLKIYRLDKEYRELQTKLFVLKKAKALELKPVVKNMLSIYGSVYVNEKDNTLYITDTPEMLQGLDKIIEHLDTENTVAGGNFTSRLITLKHTKASDISSFLEHKLSADGRIFIAGDLNGLLITDIQSKIEEAENLIQSLDVPIQHLSIAITIVELNSDYYKNIGVDITSILDSIRADLSYDIDKTDYSYDHKYPNNPSQDSKYSEKRDDSGLAFSIAGSIQLSNIIQAMTRDGKGNVLASPRLVTRNNTAASLNASEKIPYTTGGSSSEGTAKAGISLSVTPVIQQDNFINLKISPSVSNLTGWSPAGMPIIFDRSLDTEVNVKDGDTFVLGGLKKTEKVKYVRGIPILKSIPVIKYLFSKIFLYKKTPKAEITDKENKSKAITKTKSIDLTGFAPVE